MIFFVRILIETAENPSVRWISSGRIMGFAARRREGGGVEVKAGCCLSGPRLEDGPKRFCHQ